MTQATMGIKARSLPPGWKWVKLGDVSDAVRGVTFASGSTKPIAAPEFIACLTTSAVQNKTDWSTKRYVPKQSVKNPNQMLSRGDILVSTANSKVLVGKSCLIDEIPLPCTFGAFVTVIRPKETVESDWILMGLNTYEAKAFFYQASSNTTNISNLKVRDLLSLVLPLPPIEEQKRIAAILNEQMAAVEKAKKAAEERLKASKALPAAYLREVFEEDKWPLRPLGEISVLERGKFTPRPRNDPRYFGGEHPWIQIGEVESSAKYIDQYHVTLNDDGLAVSKKFPAGTLVISIAATIGALGILTFDSCMPDSLVGITPKEGISSPDFLYYLMSYTRSHLERIAPQMAQANINLSILNPLELPFPQLDEQERLAKQLDHEFAGSLLAEESIQQELETIEAMPAALLRKAFSGQL